MDITASILTVDPGSGKYLLFEDGSLFYEYNIITDSWTQLNSSGVPVLASGDVFGIVATPVSTYGVTMSIMYDPIQPKVYLYKHAAASAQSLPAVSIATNQSVYHAGDRLTVTITTDPGETTDRWYLGVALVTPVNTPPDPFSIYRFNPVVELITLQTALARPFADIAARPLSVVLAESFTILDLITLPADLPVGSYQWLTTLFSEDLSRVSDVAAAPFTFE